MANITKVVPMLLLLLLLLLLLFEFLISQLWLRNIRLSWDVAINRIRLGGLICSLKSFLQLNMFKNYRFLQLFIYIYIYIYMYSGAN